MPDLAHVWILTTFGPQDDLPINAHATPATLERAVLDHLSETRGVDDVDSYLLSFEPFGEERIDIIYDGEPAYIALRVEVAQA